MALKFALIIATVMHNGDPPEVISGPEIPYDEQRARFKTRFASERVHKYFARVELVDTRRGTIKHQNFISPEEFENRAKEIARQEKEFKASQKPAPAKPRSKPASATEQSPPPPPADTKTPGDTESPPATSKTEDPPPGSDP